jgi:ABC-type enterochelin transport system permease subunit
VNSAILFRLAALAAIIGGALRALDAFAFEFLDSDASANLFLATDIFLLFALFGLYARLSQTIGAVGLIGFVVAVIGFVMMRSAGDNIDAYVAGTATLGVGMVLLGAAIILTRAFPIWAPICWIVSLIALVLGFVTESDTAGEVIGVAFGLGFVLAGVTLFRRAA